MADDAQQPQAPVVPAPLGVDEIKNVLNFVFSLAGAVEKVVGKGSVSLFDLPGFFGAFHAAGPAIAGIHDLVPQLKDLTPAEMDDLRSYVSQNLGDLGTPVIDGLINDGLALAEQLYLYVEKLKNKQP